MARTAKLPRGVVRLPTASSEPVRQPNSNARYVAIRRGVRAGNVHRLPWDHFKTPEARTTAADRAAKDAAQRELYESGGIVRSGPLWIAVAALCGLPHDRREIALAKLQLMASSLAHDPSTQAALVFAKEILSATELQNSPEGI